MTNIETALVIALTLCVMLVMFSAQMLMMYLTECKRSTMWRNAWYDQAVIEDRRQLEDDTST